MADHLSRICILIISAAIVMLSVRLGSTMERIDNLASNVASLSNSLREDTP